MIQERLGGQETEIMPGPSRNRRRRHILSVTDDVKAPPGTIDDALLVAGDLEGFFRRRGHGEGAPDLVQDLFVVLLSRRSPEAAVTPGRFRSLLFAIAYRLGANATRRRRRDAGEALERHEPALATSIPSPERMTLLKENVHRAAAALEALPQEVRRTLLLVADDGHSTREVAALMNVTEEVVRARLSRGRRRLAAILEGRGEP
jgi:RNA polymerase sigma factor (sigma-70 family)